MPYDDRVLGVEGAIQSARNNHFETFNPEIPQRRAEYEAKLKSQGTGTVGCVAFDRNGKIAAATSTGVKALKFREEFPIQQLPPEISRMNFVGLVVLELVKTL